MMSPRGNNADGFVLLGLFGFAFSDGDLKNWMFAACAMTTAKSNRMIVDRMRRRRDTGQPFTVVVVVEVVVGVVDSMQRVDLAQRVSAYFCAPPSVDSGIVWFKATRSS